MKKFTITRILMLLGLFLISSGIHSTNKESIFDNIFTVMERTSSAGNLPGIIDNAGANRGAGFNGRYVFVASRQSGDYVYYWDVTNPDAPVQELNISGIGGGTFTLADLTAIGNHVFASNMVMPGIFKIYHWNGIGAQPSVLIEYDSGTARLGDAFTVMGDPDDFAMIIVSQHGGKSFYVWAMENGELNFDEPLVVTIDDLPANANFSRVTLPDGEDEFPVVSGPAGVFVLGEDEDIILTIEQSFFPGWPMYVNIFAYEGGRYFAFMHVKDNPAANVMYVLDITEGEDVLEALQILKNGTFAAKVLHSHDMGSIANGNASVSMDVVIDSFGNLWLMGFAAGNGFVVQRIGDAGPDGLLLPFMETFDGEGEDTPDTWLPEGWISFTLDDDGEEFNWYWSPGPSANPNGQMRSQSAYQDDGTWYVLNPDNWLVTPQIYMSEISGDEIIELSFKIGTGAQTPGFKLENYSVLISATDTEPDSFTTLWTETLTSDFEQNALYPRELDLSEYAGQDVYLAFRHHDVTDMDRLFLDDVFVQVVIPQEPQVADLTLNVRMIVWEELGIFDPAEDYVDVAGTFNNWGETPLVLTALNDDDLTYTITIPELEVGETFFFKFRINGSWDDDTAEFPFGGPPREVVLQDSNNTYSYWYNDDLPIVLYELTLLANPENGGNVEGAGNYQSGEQVLLTAIPFEGDESEPGFNPENTAILIDYTAGFESLPPIINDELTRGASFDGRYVYIVSRKNGNFIYVWDSDNPSSEHFSLDFGGVVEGGTWDISDVQVSGTYIYATNMVMHVGEVSKVYRWNGVNDSNPEVILEFTLPDHNIRLGDALSIVGTPPENGKIIMSNFAWPSNASEFFVWNFDQGNITNEIWPIDPENALRLGQYGRINAIDGEPDLYVLSGAEMGIGLINSSGELIFDTSEDIIQFRSYDPNIFEYNGARYLSYTVNREWENQGVFFEVVDISEGTDNLDALQNLTAGNINDKKVHVHSFGPANPVMWVGACNSVRFSNHGNPRILAFSLLSGFLVTEFSADPVEPGYEFINWTDPENNIVNTEAQFTYTMPDYDITLTANFEPIIVEPEVFTLSITVSPENSGTTTGAGEYLAGEQVNITAIANEGYEFVEWTNQDGNIISTMDEYSFAMPEENLEIFANFIEPEPEYFNLILLVNPEDSGVITGEGEYEAGEMVNVTATANEGYIFINWTDIEGFEVNANSSFDFQMPQENKTLVANFDLENIFDEIMPLGLKIYPNPTSDIVKISSDQQIQKIFVMDIFGKVVYSNQTVYDFYLDFNTGQLATGSYFIQIHFENFIIKRALQVLR